MVRGSSFRNDLLQNPYFKDGIEISELLKAAKDFNVQGLKFLNEGKNKAANDKYQMVLDTLEGKEMGRHEAERKDLIQVQKRTRFDSFI